MQPVYPDFVSEITMQNLDCYLANRPKSLATVQQGPKQNTNVARLRYDGILRNENGRGKNLL